jgi:hypothetical protein
MGVRRRAVWLFRAIKPQNLLHQRRDRSRRRCEAVGCGLRRCENEQRIEASWCGDPTAGELKIGKCLI